MPENFLTNGFPSESIYTIRLKSKGKCQNKYSFEDMAEAVKPEVEGYSFACDDPDLAGLLNGN